MWEELEKDKDEFIRWSIVKEGPLNDIRGTGDHEHL